ncbi:MAG TPA: glycoside hydrolase family 97 N-terminal domain-containing protein [Cyclobacteriaceae bacterium]|nr:glycoside hydrolase family 97 N-terminal domain-containing protein [Cyclobacteriaceae bacterium]
MRLISKLTSGVINLALVFLLLANPVLGQETKDYQITSPDKNVTVRCDASRAVYAISFKGKPVLKESKLGVIRSDEDFSKNFKSDRDFNARPGKG